MFNKVILRCLLAAAMAAAALSARADVFHMPSGQTSVQFVAVGDPNNPPDTTVDIDGTTGYGSVSYVYQMGKYDVTMAQYTQFLNAVAKTDPYGLYNSGMANGQGYYPFGVSQSGNPGSYSYSVTGSDPQAGNLPMTCVTWGDAARFCNWLDNGQPTAAEGNGTTEKGAYTLNGDTTNLMTETRNPGAKYFIPSENEWYKCAFFDPSNGSYWTYATQSNTPPSNSLLLSATSNNDANYYNGSYDTDPTNYLTPVGEFENSPSPFGAYDMNGDVYQWNEANISGSYSYRGLRGGSWSDYSNYLASSYRTYELPTIEVTAFGFRVASVPEPGGIALLVAALLAFGIWRRRRNA